MRKAINSLADIENNLVTNNKYGIATLNQSQVRLIGNVNASSNSQTQRIINNYQNQVWACDNSFPYYFHNNVVQNTPSGSTYLVYYDPTVPIWENNNPLFFNVKCNCFDNSNPTPQLYPSGLYQWSVWCPPSSCQFMDMGKEQFEAAIASMDSADYSTAESQFKAVIAAYPGTIYARESAKKLIPLKKISDQDFEGLKIYYDTAAALHADSLSDHLIYRLRNMCDVEEKSYPNAIAWYENDILTPASINDSVYSLIDLSDTYLLMQADSTLKSSMANYTGALAQYKPHNIQEHVLRSNEWIKLLFNDKPFNENGKGSDPISQGYMLKQNNPNPFTVSTQVSYNLPESANVSIIVTNILGQQVLEIDRNNQDAGNHSIILNFSGKPDGIYFIALIADHKEVSKIKAIKMH